MADLTAGGHSGTTTTETILLWSLSSDYRGPGVALTGIAAAIDEADHVFLAAHGADKVQVGHSVELPGPWSSPGRENCPTFYRRSDHVRAG